jgi:ribose 5-phosphate isomerase A
MRSLLPSTMSSEAEKEAAASAAAELVRDGDFVGLGTGSTVAHLLPALAARALRIRCVATSPATARTAAELGLKIVPFERVTRLDIAIDGADQIAPDGWLIKGGGSALTREKIVAAAADRFVVIASAEKLVSTLQPPVPLELLVFGLDATLAALGAATLRDVPLSPDGGRIADYHAPIADPEALAARLSQTPGIVEHGLFPPSLTTEVIVARGTEIVLLSPGGATSTGRR